MANYSSLGPNANVKKDVNVEMFPYRILNDLSKKLKAAEAVIANGVAEREALACVKDDEINNLKQRISKLTYENNRYHLAISNCTFCASDDADTCDAISSDASIRASASVSFTSSSPGPDPALSPRTLPALMSGFDVKERQADTKVKSKDKTFIKRMVKTLTKLEAKYQIPEHKRKKRLFTRKEKTSPIVPKEFDTIYHGLAAPEPDAVTLADPFPHVRWNNVRFKPALPNPEACPVHSCSPDPVFYVDRNSPSFQCNSNFDYLASQNGRPFGALPGFKTNLGVVAIPSIPVGGYVYCPEVKKWVIFAEARSPPSTGRGTRRGGATSLARRRGG